MSLTERDITTCRLWGESFEREVVAEFEVCHQKSETVDEEAQRKAKHQPAPLVRCMVVVVR